MKFSVIIPALNEEEALPKLLSSLKNQTRLPEEIIIVDGHSEDKTIPIVRTWKKTLPQIQLINSKKRNLPHQRNLGGNTATGDWLLFIDADTTLPANFLQSFSLLLEKTPCDACTTLCLPDQDDVLSLFTCTGANIGLILGSILGHVSLFGSFTAIKKSIFEKTKGYNETYTFSEDQEISLRYKQLHLNLIIFRQPRYTMSQRRYRTKGYMHTFCVYFLPILAYLFTKKIPSYLPSFQMGGHVFRKKQRSISL